MDNKTTDSVSKSCQILFLIKNRDTILKKNRRIVGMIVYVRKQESNGPVPKGLNSPELSYHAHVKIELLPLLNFTN